MAEARWLKANLGEVEGVENPAMGKAYLFGESRPMERYKDVGLNLRVLEPGQPASIYHAEEVEEFFIVLGGECLAIIDDEEVPLRKWDFLHTPPGTAHVIVGAGEGPATVLMIGGRRREETPRFPASELAARYGASAAPEAKTPQEAYESTGWDLTFEPVQLPWPPE